jgi:hypothetical protein
LIRHSGSDDPSEWAVGFHIDSKKAKHCLPPSNKEASIFILQRMFSIHLKRVAPSINLPRRNLPVFASTIKTTGSHSDPA